MPPNALCAICGLIIAVTNFHVASAQKSKWNKLISHKTWIQLVCWCAIVVFPTRCGDYNGFVYIYVPFWVMRKLVFTLWWSALTVMRSDSGSAHRAASFTSCISHRFRIPIALFHPVHPRPWVSRTGRRERVNRLCPVSTLMHLDFLTERYNELLLEVWV